MPKIALILSIVFIAISAVLGYLTIDTKKAQSTKLASLETDMKQQIQAEAIKYQAEIKAAKGLADAASAELKNSKDVLLAAQNTAAEDKKKSEELQTKLDETSKQLAEAVEKAKTATPEPTAGPSRDELANKVKEQEARVAELQEVNKTLTAKTADVDVKTKVLTDKISRYEGVARAKGLEGQILAVNNAYNFVVLSIGDRQGVVMNAQMIIKRGDRMLGKVKVTSVEPSTAIADVIPGSGARDVRILPGDRVVYSGS